MDRCSCFQSLPLPGHSDEAAFVADSGVKLRNFTAAFVTSVSMTTFTLISMSYSRWDVISVDIRVKQTDQVNLRSHVVKASDLESERPWVLSCLLFGRFVWNKAITTCSLSSSCNNISCGRDYVFASACHSNEASVALFNCTLRGLLYSN